MDASSQERDNWSPGRGLSGRSPRVKAEASALWMGALWVKDTAGLLLSVSPSVPPRTLPLLEGHTWT